MKYSEEHVSSLYTHSKRDQEKLIALILSFG
jgi:hypothetical protein